MASRKPEDLHPELAERWAASEAEWRHQYPKGKTVFLTQTLRTVKEQDVLFAQGRTKPGKIVTNARGGQSLHNYGLAFDIAFKDAKGDVDWNDITSYRQFAVIAKANGLAWGGDWRRPDYPHFEPPGMTWQKAKAGQAPAFGPISTTEEAHVCACCGQVLP